MTQTDTFHIKLSKFEGPFDLLLFFIERDELDIYDIPIAQITADFLAYLQEAKNANIDLASEFIVVAATLMRIKAKMLIPRKQLDEEGNEIDPRAELVQKLLEYKRYKSVLEELRTMEEIRSQQEKRGNTLSELKSIATKALVDAELESITLFKLLRVFEITMRNFETEQKRTVHKIFKYSYTIQGQQAFIMETVAKLQKADFGAIFGVLNDRVHAIITFLGLLELLNLQKISIVQGEGINNFWLTTFTSEN